MSYDIIIVGGGPAGLTAAIYARRAERSVLILEKNGFGGQIAQSPRVDNFPGIPSVSGAELSDRMLSHALELGVEVDLAEVTGVEPDGGGSFTVKTEDGEYGAGAVILATGARHRRLGVEREDEFAGSGVCYCAVCDGAFYPGHPVAVVGGGDTAVRDALLLTNTCSEVYIIHGAVRLPRRGRECRGSQGQAKRAPCDAQPGRRTARRQRAQRRSGGER